MKIKGKRIIVKIVVAFFIVVLTMTGCSSEKGSVGPAETGQTEAQAAKSDVTIKFADCGWDSMKFHNDLAGFIIENGYGYKTEVTTVSTALALVAVANGDLDVCIENWIEQLGNEYTDPLEKGEILKANVLFNDNVQGYYVPTYVIKGDEERGIKPIAPDLKTISDLPKYWEVFKDPEDSSKGRIIGCPSTWVTDEVLFAKVNNYGLDETYNYFRPGSDAALSTAIVTAVEKGEPIISYYWEPTWLMGMYDMTLIEEPEYNKETWDKDYTCAWPKEDVVNVVSNELPEKAPEVMEFFKKYETNSSLINEALAYMQNNEVDSIEAVKWFLKEKENVWTSWVTPEAVEKVKAKL
jgi:glycine betaine/proline transport system substrate-binding protein